MLSKVNAGSILIPNTSYNKTVTWGSISPAYYSYATADITPTPTLFNWVYTVSFTLWTALNNWGKAKLETYNNGSLVSTSPEISVGTTTTFSFTNIALANWFTLKLYLQKYNSGTQAISFSTNVTSVSSYLYKTVSTHKWLPRELKTIWEYAKSTLYGYHIDGKTWYTGN